MSETGFVCQAGGEIEGYRAKYLAGKGLMADGRIALRVRLEPFVLISSLPSAARRLKAQ